MKLFIFGFLVSLISLYSHAAYNENAQGKVSSVLTYADGDYIYFTFERPIAHSACNPQFFVISEEIPLDRRQAMLSRLLLAYAAKENVNIGYDKLGSCVHGYIRVHRVG